MSGRNFDQMFQHVPEARKILRERFKFSAKVADDIMGKVMMHFLDQPHREEIQNPRRLLLETVRKFAAAKRREEKAWATRDKKL